MSRIFIEPRNEPLATYRMGADGIVRLESKRSGLSNANVVREGPGITIYGPPPLLSIAATDAEKEEGTSGTTNFTFTVTRIGDLVRPSTVAWAVTGSGISPADAADFVGGALPSGVLTFASGAVSQIISVPVAGDIVFEGDEGFEITLTALSNAIVVAPTAEAVIEDDDFSTASSVSQYGVTFTFASPRPVGQYANGDWWVRGPVSITSISPASTVVANGTYANGSAWTNRVTNGAMVNPGNRSFASGGLAANNANNGLQGFDSLIGTAVDVAPYSAGYNVDPGKTGVPLDVTTGSVVKVISTAQPPVTAGVSGREVISDMVVLTVVDTIPAADAIRPGVARADKTSRMSASQFDVSIFENYTPPATAPSAAAAAALVARMFEVSQPESITSRNIHATNNHEEYGRDIANDVHTALLALHLNYTDAEKLAILCGAATLADDCLARAEEGGIVQGVGGGNVWKKSAMVVTAAALGSNAYADLLEYIDRDQHQCFAEDRHIFRVREYDIALPRYTLDGRPRTAYSYYMLGSAEWGEQAVSSPERNGSQWSVAYRDIIGGCLLGGTLAVELIDGAQALWNNDNLFLYMDSAWHRRAEFAPNNAVPFVEDMLVAHRPAKVAAPAIATAGAKEAAVWVRFDLALNETATVPATSDFVVNVNGSPATLSGAVTVWRQSVGLTLATPVTGNDVVTVSYTSGTNKLRSVDGVNVASFTGQAATNLTDKVGGPNAAYPVVQFSKARPDTYLMAVPRTFGSNGPLGTLALMKLRLDALPTTNLVLFGTTSGGQPVRFVINTAGQLNYTLRNAAGTIIVNGVSSANVAATTDYDILMSWDVEQATSAAGFSLYINDVDRKGTISTWGGGGGVVVGYGATGGNTTFGGANASSANDLGYSGRIGAFYLNSAARVDITDGGERAKFTSLTGGDLDIGTLGDGITGTQPAVFLVGEADQWNSGGGINRGSASKFFLNTGSVTDVSGSEWI